VSDEIAEQLKEFVAAKLINPQAAGRINGRGD
jgi:hypothetical protein